ncbi:NADP-dependent oxidoreductase [Yinghuangia sp. ASG 101]|uniref:NADP-dependent oxidoreductase n=1 Tax=Yinghuangia sp. ASG 101 TaxID=2896848 RepID=UPI001E5DBF3A|nr:NADP-dependent oxidoreductase [Yinghuangia sp. ASG 101]UGQ09647.1 NADP-dependent oxidoreductase [Yinghuangia sp. ASG 101]
MQAVTLAEFGPPDVLRLTDVPDPRPGPGQVRVRIRAAGAQPVDTSVRRGEAPPAMRGSLPIVPGNEFAGVVDLVGDGVAEVAVGDEVLGWTMLGAYAEAVAVPADQIVRKPADMPWEVAGAMSASGQTAHRALRELRVAAGETVLVHAAAGGVGTAAVQIAVAWGAAVVGTASEANHAYLRSLGATPVTYGPGLVDRVRAVAPQGVDAALDAAGRGALDASVDLVADRDRIATIADFAGAERLGLRGLRGGPGARSRERLGELLDLWSRGALTVHIGHRLPLADAAEAHRVIEAGHGRGKVVLLP